MPSLNWPNSSRQKIRLCDICKWILFEELRSAQATHLGTVHSIKLSKILRQQSKCIFCKLLLDASCQKENDLFNSDHIKNPLEEDERFVDRKDFATWYAKSPGVVMDFLRKEDYWPFGYTHDAIEKERTEAAAKTLFEKAEQRDVEPRNGPEEIDKHASIGIDTATALQTLSATVGVANIAGPNRVLAMGSTFTSQFAIWNAGKPKKMPCWYFMRLYSLNGGAKAGAISVRIYAHSRAPGSPLREISHFTLRLHEKAKPRSVGQQLWYGRELGPMPDWDFFKTCLTTCWTSHDKICGTKNHSSRAPGPSTATFRLIDTIDMKIKGFAGMSPGSPDIPPYVALSYVWGDQPLGQGWQEIATNADYDISAPDFYYENISLNETRWIDPRTGKTVRDLRLTRRSLPTLIQDRGLEKTRSEIPQTVRDAIEVVGHLEVRYLWCDRLCIIQEPEDEDRKHNIAWMGRVYSEAMITIVAADSENAFAGIKGVSSGREGKSQSPQVGPRQIVPGISLFLPVPMKRDYHPWNKRAWTFQEQFLSRRLLVFSKGYAIWHCRIGIWREDVNALDVDSSPDTELELLSMNEITSAPRLPERRPVCQGLQSIHPDGSMRLFRTSMFSDYIQLIENFSRRQITNSSDIMKAFHGVAAVFQKSMGCQFLYGIPLAYTDIALLWQPRRPMRRRIGTDIARAPPSWSPIGWTTVEESSDDPKSDRFGVRYDNTYDVLADGNGLYFRQKQRSDGIAGEERIRPRRHSIYCVFRNRLERADSTCKLKDIGMLALFRGQEVPGSWSDSYTNPLKAEQLGITLSAIHDYQLIVRTQVATLTLTRPVTIESEHWVVGIESYQRQTWLRESDERRSGKHITAAEGYVIGDTSNRDADVGFVIMTAGLGIQCPLSIEAIVLSEAQYMGNEAGVADLGYYLYNVMVIQRLQGRVAERIGLGKIWKSAWSRASPQDEVIVLE